MYLSCFDAEVRVRLMVATMSIGVVFEQKSAELQRHFGWFSSKLNVVTYVFPQLSQTDSQTSCQ